MRPKFWGSGKAAAWRLVKKEGSQRGSGSSFQRGSWLWPLSPDFIGLLAVDE